MPLPVAHSIAGYIFHEARPYLFFKKGWKDLLFLIGVANLPDIDFLPGFLIGEPNRFHHEITHTFFAALLAGIILSFFFSRKTGGFWKYFIMIFSAYCSHLCLDYFTVDLKPPFGMELFWPFSVRYYMSDYTVFFNVIRSEDSATFFQSMVNLHNINAVFREALVMGTVAVLVKLFRKKSEENLF